MSLEQQIIRELTTKGADFVRFVDISQLSIEQTKGFPVAILFGIALSASYLQHISHTPGYVKEMVKNKLIEQDEFHLKEKQTDRMADELEELLVQKGYAAYAQSEDHIAKTGFYDFETQTTPLPHKTIAGLAGLGWIGKHNLLVTSQYGSAMSMCTVLTNAPLPAERKEVQEPQCGSCSVCQSVCLPHALRGSTWNQFIRRDAMVDVYECTTCLRCMVLCPHTQKYIQRSDVS